MREQYETQQGCQTAEDETELYLISSAFPKMNYR